MGGVSQKSKLVANQNSKLVARKSNNVGVVRICFGPVVLVILLFIGLSALSKKQTTDQIFQS